MSLPRPTVPTSGLAPSTFTLWPAALSRSATSRRVLSKAVSSSTSTGEVNPTREIPAIRAFQIATRSRRIRPSKPSRPPPRIMRRTAARIRQGDCGYASGPASLILTEQRRRVGSLGPGLTSDSADAVRVVLRDDLSAGPQVYGTSQRCRPDLPSLDWRPGFIVPTGQRCVPSLNLRKGWL
jgi:hypothetical protein